MFDVRGAALPTPHTTKSEYVGAQVPELHEVHRCGPGTIPEVANAPSGSPLPPDTGPPRLQVLSTGIKALPVPDFVDKSPSPSVRTKSCSKVQNEPRKSPKLHRGRGLSGTVRFGTSLCPNFPVGTPSPPFESPNPSHYKNTSKSSWTISLSPLVLADFHL